MKLGLEGRRALVTGAGSGIGAATVERLLDEGASVIAVDRNADACDRLSSIVGVTAVQLDVSDADAGERLAETVGVTGGLDVLVNNVGVAPTRAGFLDTTASDWRRGFEVNFFSVVTACSALLPFLIESRGVIVNVASTSGRFPEPMLVDYAAAKAALLSLTGSLATEFGPRGVRVVALAPGPTRTPLWDRPGGFVDGLSERYGLDREAAVDHHIRDVRQIALGKPGVADDAAAAIVFLASSAASHITGTTLAVHGGMATHLM